VVVTELSGAGHEVDDGVEDGREVATEVQSKIPSRTISPAMLTGTLLESRHSVKARDVASVPPRWEPYSINGRVVVLERGGDEA
jgi:hypothetical protein